MTRMAKRFGALLAAVMAPVLLAACVEILAESHYATPITYISENTTWLTGWTVDITQYSVFLLGSSHYFLCALRA